MRVWKFEAGDLFFVEAEGLTVSIQGHGFGKWDAEVVMDFVPDEGDALLFDSDLSFPKWGDTVQVDDDWIVTYSNYKTLVVFGVRDHATNGLPDIPVLQTFEQQYDQMRKHGSEFRDAHLAALEYLNNVGDRDVHG